MQRPFPHSSDLDAPLSSSPPNTVPEFIEATQEKIRNLKVEEELVKRKKHAAAIKIQKRVRGWLTRNHLKMLNMKATTIQRYWRGYKGRLGVAEYIEKLYNNMVENYYHKMATRIQALWRGSWSRKSIFDYYKQKAWLKSVELANENTLKKMQELRDAEEKRAAKETADEYEPWLHYMANKLHHFLRTQVRPGIYSNLQSPEYTDIEKFLASYQYRGFMTDLRRDRLITALRELMSRPVVADDGCAHGVTKKRCLAAFKARHTISNPTLNSQRN